MGCAKTAVINKEVITNLLIGCFRKGGGLRKEQGEGRLRKGKRWQMRIRRSKL